MYRNPACSTLLHLFAFATISLLSLTHIPAQNLAPRVGEETWIDSVLSTLTLEEKVGQLIMISAYPKQGSRNRDYTARLIRAHKLGGVMFMQSEPAVQREHLAAFRQSANLPLLVAQDAEWGLGMRMNAIPDFPKNMTLGAISNDSLLYAYGAELARQLREVGVNVNFAPVADVNNNPRNPVIGNRSFGDDKYNVARKVIQLSRGLQDNGVLAVLKHFPGHGDTETDSHASLPTLNMSRGRLDTLELYPFMRAIEYGAGGVMVGHLRVPALDDTPDRAVSLSPKVIGGLLRKEMNFRGLIFTDALNMRGVTNYYRPGPLAVQAFRAGNDVLLDPLNVPQTVAALITAFRSGDLPLSSLDRSVRRILRTKYRLRLDQPSPIPQTEPVFSPTAEILRRRLFEASLTLLRNKKNLLPLRQLERRNIAYVRVGGDSDVFGEALKKYDRIHTFSLPKNPDAASRQALLRELEAYNTVIVGVYDIARRRYPTYGVADAIPQFTQALRSEKKSVVTVLFGTPYAASRFERERNLLIAYDEDPVAQQSAASAVFGGIRVNGRLPISASEVFPAGSGVDQPNAIRFGFAEPEGMGFDRTILGRIDSLALHYIDRGAMPGCAVLVGRGNRIVYAKGFGRETPSSNARQIDPYWHMYDLASVTKVAATTLSVMEMNARGWLDLDKGIGTYWRELKGTDNGKITPRALLQHRSGLARWVPFYQKTYASLRNRSFLPGYYSHIPRDSFHVPIAPNFYGTPRLRDSVWYWIRSLEVHPERGERYSDPGMITLGRVVEEVSGTNIDRYTHYRFYRPMGMSSTMFQPGLKGLAGRCPPTVIDRYWRKTTVKGYVHDESAAILGGRAGNAGLFSNVYDLAKLLFMWKNGGTYGGDIYLPKNTIEDFTKRYARDTRRGLGFDKPEIDPGKSQPTSVYASPSTYGHSGFTGTCLWVDPESDLIYVFLTNRTWPYAKSNLLNRENVRTQIMDQIYLAMRDRRNL